MVLSDRIVIQITSDPGETFLDRMIALVEGASRQKTPKYFAIVPAMFIVVYPKLRVLNVMHLDNPHTAILAAVIYNALIIPALIPLAPLGR